MCTQAFSITMIRSAILEKSTKLSVLVFSNTSALTQVSVGKELDNLYGLPHKKSHELCFSLKSDY